MSELQPTELLVVIVCSVLDGSLFAVDSPREVEVRDTLLQVHRHWWVRKGCDASFAPCELQQRERRTREHCKRRDWLIVNGECTQWNRFNPGKSYYQSQNPNNQTSTWFYLLLNFSYLFYHLIFYIVLSRM